MATKNSVNPYKLGLFVIIGLVAFFASLMAFGARALKRETLPFKTYFNESVQGLEVGSPVKYRGVTIGYVARSDIAPDLRHVEVTMDLNFSDVARLHLTDSANPTVDSHVKVPPDLRTQLVSQGITGVKFVQMDFFDVKSNPPEELPFPVGDNTIPSAVSTLKSLEASLVGAVNRIPELTDGVLQIMLRINRILEDFQGKQVPDAAKTTLAHADDLLKSLNATMKRIEAQGVVDKSASTIENLNKTVAKFNTLLDRLDGDKGLLTSAQRATDSFGDLGKSATGTTRELDATLREIREAAEAVRAFLDALEKDPDMLLKGKAKRGGSK